MHCLQRGDRQRGRRAASAESRAGRHKLVQGGSWEELDAGGIAAVRPRAVPETSREVRNAAKFRHLPAPPSRLVLWA